VGKIQTGRFERLGARTYSIKGPGALVDLDETVLGVLQLERQAGMEAHLLQEWETFAIHQEKLQQALGFAWIALSNPVGSNRLMVIDSWARDSAVLYDVYISAGVPPAFNPGNVAKGIDTRIPNSRQPAGRVFELFSSITSFGTQIMQLSSSNIQEYPIVLAPDGTLLFRAGAHNETLDMSLRWAERDAAPFEL